MQFSDFARAIDQAWRGRGVGLVVAKDPPSTHLLARRVVAEYAAECEEAPSVDLLAWGQSEGRGRLEGRGWTSPAGEGIYATLVRWVAGETLQTLPLRVAVALAESLNGLLGGRCRIKWPNDLWVAERKLGGILIDATSRGPENGGGLAVISFGVNHGRVDVAGATSLAREVAEVPALPELAAQLTSAIDGELGAAASSEAVVGRYRELSLHRPGEILRCQLGADEVEGTFEGFDPRGFLRLAVDGEERLVTAGEIHRDERSGCD